jgi:general secretion pathway protein A
MYEVFYRLKEKPFSLLPDPSYLYLSEKHQMALTLLEYSLLNQAGFCVISGVTGAGKTTLIRHLLNQFGNDVAVGLITNTHQSFSDLLRWILMAFNLDYNSDSKPQLYQTFVNFLIEQYAKNRNTVLIVDEAQNMSVETLEELRMLSNINADKDQVLQIILVGQPGLRDKLSRADLEQFAQRIAVDYHIEPLNAEETRNYIRHRLTIAGGDPELFEDDAAQSVYRSSSGIPRLINLLCENALVYGYAESVSRISARLVEEVARERQSHGLLPRMQSESVYTASHPTTTPREIGGAKKASHAPAPDLTPVASPLPAEDEVLAETVRNAERAVSAVGGNSAANMSETRQPPEAQQHAYRGEATEAAKHTAMTQGEAARERHAGVISKLVHLDARPRSATDSDHANRPVTRTEVNPQVSNVVTSALQKLEPTEAAEGKDGGAALPQEVVTLSPDRARDMPDEVTDASQAEGPIAAVHKERDMTDDNNSRNRTPGMGTGSKWIVGTALGFSGGLLVAVVLFVTTYFKLAIDVPAAPPAAGLPSSATAAAGPSISVPATPAENTAPVDQAMLKALQRERDAAIAQTRALERERDAALAAAKAREREKAATQAAIKEQERAAALAATNMQLSTPPVEPKPVPRVEAVIPVPAAKTVETAVHVESKPAAAETPAKFSANPCLGPSAKFLSTCKE